MSRRVRAKFPFVANGLLCAVAVLVAVPSRALTQESAAELTELAAKLVDDGSYRQAIQRLQRALAIDRKHARAHFVMGYALGRLGEHALAAEAFLAAAQLRPAWPEAHRMAALAAANAGRMEVIAEGRGDGRRPRLRPRRRSVTAIAYCIQSVPRQSAPGEPS